jgi:hypothetical protein
MRSRRWELGGEALAEMGADGAALAEIKPAAGAAMSIHAKSSAGFPSPNRDKEGEKMVGPRGRVAHC